MCVASHRKILVNPSDLGSLDVNPRRCDQFHGVDLGSNFHPLKSRLLLWFGNKSEEILVIESAHQIPQVRRERDRGLIPEEVCFSTRFVRNLRKITLAPIHPPEASSKMSGTACVNRVDQD